MIITFEIKADTEEDATKKAHDIGNKINLPFEVGGMMDNDAFLDFIEALSEHYGKEVDDGDNQGDC